MLPRFIITVVRYACQVNPDEQLRRMAELFVRVGKRLRVEEARRYAPYGLTPAQGRTLAVANVNDDMSFTVGKVRQVADELTGNISTLANTSRTNASTGLLVTSLVTLLLLLLVLLIFTMVARSLTRPLRKLVSAGFSSLAAP